MKLAVIGGGGVRSMFLAKSIASRAKELGITKLVFMDNDEIKLSIFGTMAKRIAELISPDLNFSLTTDSIEAVKDADYVITTIRSGGDSMRVKDERIALDMGILGQETTGAAGFSFAMRSIPALIEYCEQIKEYSSPDVKVFNFTNPAGLVSQALCDKGYDFTFGICDAPSSMLNSFAELYDFPVEKVYGRIYGLNHLSFFSSVTFDGKEMIDDLIENDEAYIKTDLRYFDKELLKRKHIIPNEYLYYFFNRETAVKNIINAEKTRGELIEEVNSQMIKELSEVDIEADFDLALKIFEKYYGIRENAYMAEETGIRREKVWRFDPFSKDDGGYAGVALRYIDIVRSGNNGKMIFCTKNLGALSYLEDDDVVEVTCDIGKDYVVPEKYSSDETDHFADELIRRMKYYERTAAKAILNKDKSLAVDALAAHPLIESYSLAKKLLDEYIALNEAYSSGWK